MVSRSDAMEFLSKNALEQRGFLETQTEEAAKTALVLPFIQALGYEIFNPMEVVPEFTADVGTKQGEKVDYAIMRDGKPAIVFECKKISDPLDPSRVSQLVRYFNNTDSLIGVLTNGIVYKFFADLDKENIMDQFPFLVIDITKPDATEFDRLDEFSKDKFDPEGIKSSAASMKYIRGIKGYLAESYTQPDEEFVEFLARKVLPSGHRFTTQRREQFKGLAKRAFHSFVSDQINSMLKRAQEISVESYEPTSEVSTEDAETADTPQQPSRVCKNIETTVEEIEAYELIKVIVGDIADPDRVAMRDQQTYCGVLFDDNNRKPVCRLRFNNPSRKEIEIFAFTGGERTSTSHRIESISDISTYANQLCAVVSHYAQE